MSPEAERNSLQNRIRHLETQLDILRRPRTTAELDELSAAQSRADHVAAQFGTTAPPPVPGEAPSSYRRRLLSKFQQHSEPFKDARLDGLPAEVLGAVEERIFADAVAAAKDPASYKPGELRAIQEPDASGRVITRYVGDAHAWMVPFMTGATVGRIVNPRELKR